jgi:hypothetical protein
MIVVTSSLYFNIKKSQKQCVVLSGKTPYEVFTEKEYGTIVESLEINLPKKLRIWG